ncbi:MAG: FkbM family methyltransferase [Acidobacteria bacterium]|nr:MAG: FkbM family methyltransferase [Acidobacteriota bacterium]
MPDSERGNLELAYAVGLYENPTPDAAAADIDGARNMRLEIAEERRSSAGQYLKKTVQFFYLHGPWFVLRKALWRYQFTRFRRRCDAWRARAGAKPVTVNFLDQEFELHPSGKGLSEEILLLGTHEPVCTRVYLQHLREGDQVLDVGSNLGYYALLAGRAVGPAGRVLGFEPARDVFAILERNVARSGLTNIQVFPWAISNQNKAIEFYGSEIPSWGSLIREQDLLQAQPTTVPAKRLDDLLEEFPGFHPTVLRMDVEGAEMMALEAAQRLLQEYRPRIFVEIHPFAFEWERAHKTIISLRDMGYSSGVVIERIWDEPWASRWLRERRHWSGSTDKLLEIIESRGEALNTGVFSILLEPGKLHSPRF